MHSLESLVSLKDKVSIFTYVKEEENDNIFISKGKTRQNMFKMGNQSPLTLAISLPIKIPGETVWKG